MWGRMGQEWRQHSFGNLACGKHWLSRMSPRQGPNAVSCLLDDLLRLPLACNFCSTLRLLYFLQYPFTVRLASGPCHQVVVLLLHIIINQNTYYKSSWITMTYHKNIVAYHKQSHVVINHHQSAYIISQQNHHYSTWIMTHHHKSSRTISSLITIEQHI